MNKETIVNIAIKTTDLDSVCTGVCTINTELSLIVKMKSAIDKEYENLNSISTIWGEYVYFEISGESNNTF